MGLCWPQRGHVLPVPLVPSLLELPPVLCSGTICPFPNEGEIRCTTHSLLTSKKSAEPSPLLLSLWKCPLCPNDAWCSELGCHGAETLHVSGDTRDEPVVTVPSCPRSHQDKQLLCPCRALRGTTRTRQSVSACVLWDLLLLCPRLLVNPWGGRRWNSPCRPRRGQQRCGAGQQGWGQQGWGQQG